MIETCAIRVREQSPRAPLGAALAEHLSDEGERHRKVEGYAIRQEHGPEWFELSQYPGHATQFCSWVARTLEVPLLVIVASLDDVAYLRQDGDADDAQEPLPEGMAQVVYLHVEASGQIDDRSAQYDPDAEEAYACGDPWETLVAMLELHLPESSISRIRTTGYLPAAGVPERLELLCSMITSAGSFGTRTIGGATMVSVESGGARRFERIQDGDLALIKGATGLEPAA